MKNPLGAGNGMVPHYSGTTLDAQARYANGTKSILENYISGKAQEPQNVIVGLSKFALCTFRSFTDLCLFCDRKRATRAKLVSNFLRRIEHDLIMDILFQTVSVRLEAFFIHFFMYYQSNNSNVRHPLKVNLRIAISSPDDTDKML
jgi:hypothetical protein